MANRGSHLHVRRTSGAPVIIYNCHMHLLLLSLAILYFRRPSRQRGCDEALGPTASAFPSFDVVQSKLESGYIVNCTISPAFRTTAIDISFGSIINAVEIRKSIYIYPPFPQGLVLAQLWGRFSLMTCLAESDHLTCIR